MCRNFVSLPSRLRPPSKARPASDLRRSKRPSPRSLPARAPTPSSWRRRYVEIESGKRDDRPQLAKAMEHARLTGATLLIAKLDRLSRDAHFLIGLQKAGVAIRRLPTCRTRTP